MAAKTLQEVQPSFQEFRSRGHSLSQKKEETEEKGRGEGKRKAPPAEILAVCGLQL
jgi:hypothetical protein